MGKTICGLVIAGLLSAAAASNAAVLESPAEGAALSGLGFISGWKCDGKDITVTIDGGEHLPVAMNQERGDLRPVCGTIRHGFIMQINWALLGDGEHVVVAYDDGVEFGQTTFTVGTTGEEFLKEARRRSIIENFPSIGEDTLLEWNESTQHFEILTVFESPVRTVYDREWWRQYNDELAVGTYETHEFLYAEEPDVETCFAGRLTQAAKNRALEAANQIRALHGLSAVRYSTIYSQQMQEAALIQAANRFLTHHPDPEADCYTAEGAEGSGTSNLTGYSNGRLANRDPARNMVGWTNDADNLSQVAAVGHRRWVLNPFASYFSYGQVHGYAAHKVFNYTLEPSRVPSIAVDFVAFPYKVYPFPLVEGDPPWSISVIEHPDEPWKDRFDYFQAAIITVTRVADGVELSITDRYTDDAGHAIPNILSWQVQGWEYDTAYEVAIRGVTMQAGSTRDYVYSVFIERDNLEQ